MSCVDARMRVSTFAFTCDGSIGRPEMVSCQAQ